MVSIITDQSHFSKEEIDKLVNNLFHYNYLSEFENDIVTDAVGTQYTVQKAEIMIGRKSAPWVNGSIKNHREYFSGPLALKIRIYTAGRRHGLDGAVESAMSFNGKNPYPEEAKDYSLYFTPNPMPFFSDPSWEDIDLRIDLIHPENKARLLKEWTDAYPPIIDEKFMMHKGKKKEVRHIDAFSCRCASQPTDAVKDRKCAHSVYIYFEDGTNLMYWGGGPDISVQELEQKGYLPFISQYRPDEDDKYEVQLKKCGLTQKIGKDKLRMFRW